MGQIQSSRRYDGGICAIWVPALPEQAGVDFGTRYQHGSGL